MADILYLDTETYSATPIKHGTHKYIENCELMVVTWARNDGPLQCWDVTTGAPIPASLCGGLRDAQHVVAHNAMFDRNVLRHALPEYTAPDDKWECCMVRALAHALPGSLDALCDILHVDAGEAKHKTGRQLVLQFCKPSAAGRKTAQTHPEDWAAFLAYAMADISAMRAVWARLPAWNYGRVERGFYHLDQVINDRGMCVDLELVQACVEAVHTRQTKVREEVHTATYGEVVSATQRDVLLAHILREYGVSLPDMQKSTIERRLNDPDLPEGARELLRARQQASTTSTAKYLALARGANSDGRLRGTIQFAGGSRTLRASGRSFQPQNLPSRGLLEPDDIDIGIDALRAGVAPLVYTDVMRLTASTIRGCIVAPAGKKLVIADLANIEGRTQAWLAGEAWKLDAFRAYDAGTGPDLYKLAYSKSFGVPVDAVTKTQRQIGKVQELMLAYGGGVGAYLTGAMGYGIDLEGLSEIVQEAADPALWEEADGYHAYCAKEGRNTYGLSRRAFVACDTLKRAWRLGHPAITNCWAALEQAARSAVQNPKRTFTVGGVSAIREGGWLRLVLPSGHVVCYPAPRVDDNGLSYMGMNQYTKKWERIRTYGGKIFENLNQSIARDVLYWSMPEAEREGYQIVLHVHDELVTEVPDTEEYSAEGLSALMSAGFEWSDGLPLAAAGFEAYRYKKG